MLRPALGPNVPADITNLFDVARGAMLYGSFFYPLFTLGLEQVFRAAESAVTAKCRAIGIPRSEKTFEKRLGALHTRGVLSTQEHSRWTALRCLRNIASHPERQAL